MKIYSVESLDKDFFLLFNLGLITLLTVFDTAFSKFQVFGPLYLHDFLLLIGAVLSLIAIPWRSLFLPVILILAISAGYLVYSILHYKTGMSIIIRQFALFGYMGCYYLLNRNYQNSSSEIIRKFLIYFGAGSVLLQTSYIIYCIIRGTFDPFDFHNHYWYSHAGVLGLMVSAASVLLYVRKILHKCIALIYIFFLGWATGHASAQLALLVVIVGFVSLTLPTWRKFIPITIGFLITLVLVLSAPQFKDKNTDWRLLTWSFMMKELIIEHHGLTGNGFGAAYTSTKLEDYLFEQISSTAVKERGRPDERYISPAHNSFITIFFAIGILPGLLIFYPYRYVLRHLADEFQRDRHFDYLLILSLMGATVWVSFNVVLELPHSAGCFWLIYFTFWQRQKIIQSTASDHKGP